MEEVCIAAKVVLYDEKKRVLLQLRDGGVHKHKWSLFGGTQHPNESPVQAAVREIHEELGLEIAYCTPLDDGIWDKWHIFTFSAPLPTSLADIRLGEGAGFGLFSPEMIHEHPLTEYAKEMLNAFWKN